ncbi:MAG: bifunctional diguanylate cyclase/phosphodiesterase, partial [Actinomycetota bacterium]|nr:bifunctional diguanylate cyclase/phosphodiesterase [Actinomycetota bacterium]
MKGLRKRGFPLLAVFAIAGAIPMVVLAAILARQIETRVTEENLRSATEAAELIASLGIQPLLKKSDLGAGLTESELARLDDRLRAGLLGKEFARIKIWNLRSEIIYSEDSSLIGERFETPPDLAEALEGHVEAEVSDLEEDEEASERSFGRLLEVYVPIYFSPSEEPAGAFEIYLPYEPIAASINEDVMQLRLWMLGGLALLYVILYRIVARASSKLREQANELTVSAHENEFLAFHDTLTELPNRRLFRDRLQQAILGAQRDGSWLALMILDVNRFKEINDTLGHHNGDVLLKTVARRLSKVLRPEDSLARLGGDEFAILLTRVADRQAVMEVARRVHNEFDQLFEIQDLSLDVSGSSGIAIYPEHGSEADDLIQRADVAMYVAKESHAGFEIYDPAQDRYTPGRLQLVGELRQAIDNDGLELHYQPKIGLDTGRVVGVEALVRWQHPERGIVGPDEFIGLAEHTGLIKSLTARVLDMALRQQRAWIDAGLQVSVSVNLSVRNLMDSRLPEQVASQLAKWRVPASQLTLEITESSIMADPVRTKQILEAISSMGVSLSVDDFGIGHSSLSYLKQLPVSEIKIDRSFVMDMQNNGNDAVIVRSTVDLGRNLGLRIVAEGVEDAPTYGTLTDLGCDVAQGYFISRPLPGIAMTQWIT